MQGYEKNNDGFVMLAVDFHDNQNNLLSGWLQVPEDSAAGRFLDREDTNHIPLEYYRRLIKDYDMMPASVDDLCGAVLTKHDQHGQIRAAYFYSANKNKTGLAFHCVKRAEEMRKIEWRNNLYVITPLRWQMHLAEANRMLPWTD